jgi:uncharacterized membrane protein
LGGAALGLSIGCYLSLKGRLDSLESELEARDRRRWTESPATALQAQNLEPHARPAPIPPAWDPEPAPPPLAAEVAVSPRSPAVEAPRPLFEPATTSGAADFVIEEPWRLKVPEVTDSALVRWVRDYFVNGNLVVRVGLIVLFFGVAFLLKFAAERHMLPIELRLAGVAAGGAALLIIGWRMRGPQRMYALALQGGGVGLLYLTVFAALRLYALLPPTACFALLVAIAGLSAFLAVGQNSLALAALGATGGFLAPVLASTGQGNHVVLFSYYALLDAGIVAIAWFKAWRPLNLLAFVFTFGIGTGWGVLRYLPEDFASTEPFLLLFFAMFLAVAVLFALRRPPQLNDYVDGTLVFGTPVVSMLLQAGLVHGRPYALAFSALALGAVYLALAVIIWRRSGQQLRLLAESFLALGVAFITLAVPLALNGHWTAATWALEGAAIFWVGMRQKRLLAIGSGLLLQLGAAAAFMARYDVSAGPQPPVGSEFLGALFIALGGFAIARVLHLHRQRLVEDAKWLAPLPVYWALGWWFLAWLNEIRDFLPHEHQWPAFLLLTTVTVLGCAGLARWNDWRDLRPPTLLLLPAMFLAAIVNDSGHLLVGSGALAWPLAILAWTWLLRWRGAAPSSVIDSASHVATVWLFAGLASFEIDWQLAQLRLGDAVWHGVVWGLVPAAVLALLLWGAKRQRWPMTALPLAYLRVAPAGIAVYLAFWLLYACRFDGSAEPLPYLPIANPADIAQWLVLGTLLHWLLYLLRDSTRLGGEEVIAVAPQLLAALAFIVLNAVLLRALHHFGRVDYVAGALARSTLVQAALSIFWGALALVSMVFATQRGQRAIWFVGAGLLAVVLVKLFLVDLAQIRSIARIVSFIGVGVLMLVIGRYSPLPPAGKQAA